MTLAVVLEGGGEGEALSLDRQTLHLRSPRAFAPGSPVSFTARLDGRRYRFESRTIGSRRTDDGAFEVKVRLVNLRKEAREALRAGLGTGV